MAKRKVNKRQVEMSPRRVVDPEWMLPEPGEPEPIPESVFDAVMDCKRRGRVAIIVPELVATDIDTGTLQHNPCLWIMDHREEYVRGMQNGFAVTEGS